MDSVERLILLQGTRSHSLRAVSGGQKEALTTAISTQRHKIADSSVIAVSSPQKLSFAYRAATSCRASLQWNEKICPLTLRKHKALPTQADRSLVLSIVP